MAGAQIIKETIALFYKNGFYSYRTYATPALTPTYASLPLS